MVLDQTVEAREWTVQIAGAPGILAAPWADHRTLVLVRGSGAEFLAAGEGVQVTEGPPGQPAARGGRGRECQPAGPPLEGGGAPRRFEEKRRRHHFRGSGRKEPVQDR